MDQDKDNGEQSSKEVSKKRTRGPTMCKKLKKRILNQNLECSISFNEYGDPFGDMLKDYSIYVGSVVRYQVDINIESWEVVNEGLKDAIWDDIKNRWKLDDSRKKHLLERAGKQWRDFKANLTKKYVRTGKDPCGKYNFITKEMWEIFKKRRETVEFKISSTRDLKDHIKAFGHSHACGFEEEDDDPASEVEQDDVDDNDQSSLE